MARLEDERKTVLEDSLAYYGHLAYYRDLLFERNRHIVETTKRQVDFVEFALRTYAPHKVREVLDVACGNGRHILELTRRGYNCTGLDYTPEQVQMARARAKREGLSVKLLQSDATKLKYENRFDVALALFILFILPDDDSVLMCLRQVHRALKPGGIMVCNIANPFYDGENWYSLKSIQRGNYFGETRIPGMRSTSIDRVKHFDPVHGVASWEETIVIEAPDGGHVFREHEHLRLLTYWDTLHYLHEARFKEINCYPDWKTRPPKKPKAEWLVLFPEKIECARYVRKS
jgi:SAM-dependent methyltransferase